MLRYFMILSIFFHFQLFAKKENIQLNICTDEVPQIPFVIIQNGYVKGILADIVTETIQNLKDDVEITVNIESTPWSRCLHMAEKGEVDAILNASYNNERAVYLNFPPGSGSKEKEACSSQFKIACNGYVVITLKPNSFNYDGKVHSLPKPIRVSRGYSIALELEKILDKDSLDIGKSDLINVKKLIRDKMGSVVAFTPFLYELKQYKEISDKLKVHKKHYSKKSYYMPFSKKSKISEKVQILIWSKIKKISNDKNESNKIFDRYITSP